MIRRGAYKDMHACLMAHPGPGPKKSAGTGPSLAIKSLTVEYFGHTCVLPLRRGARADQRSAHAGAQPWEGQNALDAAVLAYNAIAVLRQQIKPTHRVHGIVEGRDWAPNSVSRSALSVKLTGRRSHPGLREDAVDRARADVRRGRGALRARAQLLQVRRVPCPFFLAHAPQGRGARSRMPHRDLQGPGAVRARAERGPRCVLPSARAPDAERAAGDFAAVAKEHYGVETSPEVAGAIGGSTDFVRRLHALLHC